MSSVRVGLFMVAVVAALAGAVESVWALDAADMEFLKKKIVARWNITGKGQIEAALARGVDVLEHHPSYAAGAFTVLVSADELDQLRADGYKLDVLDPDWYASYAAKSTATMGGFLTWMEAVGGFNSKLDSFHTAYPSITTAKFSLGDSYEGNPLWAIKISDNPDVDENEPEILFTAMHHAREPIGLEVVLHTIRTLMFNYGTDPVITQLVNEREIYVVPCLNPDGYLYNEMISPTGGGMWRKNRRIVQTTPTIVYGTDLNRNYAHMWGFDNIGSSPNPSSDTYRGPSAFSEPELQLVRDFVQSRNFVIAVNFHSFSNLFLWAPGYDEFYSADEPLFRAIGDSVTSFNGYSPQPGWALYVTNGDSDDWMYFSEGILSFTPEVGSGSDGFWPNPARIPTLVNENIPGNLLLIDLADTPQRILPPVTPTWVSPDTVTVPDYTLTWSDPGGLNGAVAFRLAELVGRSVVTDFSDDDSHWNLSGFSLSPTRGYNSTESFWGGSSNNRRARQTALHYYRPAAGDTLRARMWYNIETDWDYAYAEVSNDFGANWYTLPGNITTNTNPHGTNRGNGITGSSGGNFVEAKFPLTSYTGEDVLIRFSYETDGAELWDGVWIDNISPVVTFASEVELEAATPASTYPVTGKAPGDYFYTLRSTDAHGQQSATTPPHLVTVNYTTCDCTCHADPSCDGSDNVLDVIETVNIAFRGATPTIDASCPHDPAGRADVNCDGATSVIDVVRVVGVAFRGEDPAVNFCDPCNP